MTSSQKVNVFVSYCHTDKLWLERLKVHLKPLEQRGKIVLWSDEKIDPGKKWKDEVEKALKESVVAVLLISADFLASEFIHSNELPPLLAAAARENTVIFPLIISHSAFPETESLCGYQSVNAPDKPLKGMVEVEQDAVFYKLYKSISGIVKKREDNRLTFGETESPQPTPHHSGEEVSTSRTSAKKRILIWLLLATIVPFILGIIFLVGFIIPPYLKKSVTGESNPKETQDVLGNEDAASKSVVASQTEGQKKGLAVFKTKLRSKPIQEYSPMSVEIMLKEQGFFATDWNKASSGFSNQYEVQKDGKVVYDHSSGLMWQQSGSTGAMSYEKAKVYIDALNSQAFASYRDWRLPTVEEAMSLMEPTTMNGNLYIDPKFDIGQRWIWTSDTYNASSAWVVSFINGNCNVNDFTDYSCVRAVR